MSLHTALKASTKCRASASLSTSGGWMRITRLLLAVTKVNTPCSLDSLLTKRSTNISSKFFSTSLMASSICRLALPDSMR
ncbi:hypothetical protein D3C72_2355300 [compost metagenome]